MGFGFMGLSLKSDTQADTFEAFNNTSLYLDDISTSTTEFLTLWFLSYTPKSRVSAPFLDLDLSISNGIIPSKIYDKRDDFDFAIVNYPHLNLSARSVRHLIRACFFCHMWASAENTFLAFYTIQTHLKR